MKYAVDIFESVLKTVVVDAATEEDAIEEAKRRYFNGEPMEANDPVFEYTEIDLNMTRLLNETEAKDGQNPGRNL